MSQHKQRNIVNLAKVKVPCKQCNIRQHCLPAGLNSAVLEQLGAIVKQGHPLARGEHVFRAGNCFSGIYTVRVGAAKSFIVTENGEEQVTGFHLPGEFFGLDGIHNNYHPCSTIALDTASICKIPLNHIEELARQVPRLQHHLLQLMSREIFRDEQLMQVLSKKSADERLASLLYDLAIRFEARGLAATEFLLPMSRTDIANYLGLALETVCRLFTRLQDEGLLSINRKKIVIHNISAIHKLAGAPDSHKPDRKESVQQLQSRHRIDAEKLISGNIGQLGKLSRQVQKE